MFAVMRKSLDRFQPAGAWADLRFYLGRRQPHQWGFAGLAVAIVIVTIWAFWHDSQFEKPYHRDIVYVQQWRADRSDAQIVAQQKIDGPREAALKAAEEQRLEANRQALKRIDDKLKRWGI